MAYLALSLACRRFNIRPSRPRPEESAMTLDASALNALTEREKEVLRTLADGCGRKTAARRLGIAPATVEAHTQHARAKLGVRKTFLAVMALQAAERGS
jgi:DNA-binding NarL/FixJ family response regulator